MNLYIHIIPLIILGFGKNYPIADNNKNTTKYCSYKTSHQDKSKHIIKSF